MKKASELATLCGIEITLAFTDQFNNIHTFSNTENIYLSLKPSYANTFKDANVYTFTEADVTVFF